MPVRVLRPVLLALLLSVGLPVPAAEFSSNAAVTSDYVFRGISQSSGRVAWQLGGRVDLASGIYGSVWTSRVEFASAPAANAEIDYVFGIRRELGDGWTGDFNATKFTYGRAPQLNYLEWNATATWRERRWVTLGISRDVFATGRSGLYTQAGVRIPLRKSVRLEFAGGYYWLEPAYGRNYAHLQTTLAWLPRPDIEVRLSGHLADHQARVLFGDPAEPRLEASLQTSF